MADARLSDMAGFSLGTPALVCRWRLSSGMLLLENRHMRTLGRRIVNGRPIPPELVAWAKQHIEWTLIQGSAEYPDGVLMLIVDENGAAAMTVGPYEPLALRTTAGLMARARDAAREQAETDVAPETLFAHAGGVLLAGAASDAVLGGCAGLVLQLSAALGISVSFDPDLADALGDGSLAAQGVFLASDEHGIVAADDCADTLVQRFAASYARLFESARPARS